MYKTVRTSKKFHTAILLAVAIYIAFTIVINWILGSKNELISIFIIMIFIGVGSFIYCWSEAHIRNRYYTNGKRYDATIVRAEWLLNGRGEDTYYLIICFYDDSKQLLYRKTNGYVGSPNVKLKSPECAVYEWKGKYMEGEFQTVEDGETGGLDIPVAKYKQLRTKGKDYV